MRIKYVIATLLLLTAPAYAQTGTSKTVTQLNTEINTQFPDNATGAITPFIFRQLILDMAASFLNFFGGNGIITPPAGTTVPGITVLQSGPSSGTLGANLNYNQFIISNDQLGITGSFHASGLTVDYTFGGSNLQGVRTATYSHSTFSAASSASNSNGNYIADTARIDINASDGGTNTGAGAKGAFFGRNTVVAAESVVLSNVGSAVGHEYDFSLSGTSSLRAIVGTTVVKLNADVRGVVYDAAYSVSGNGPGVWNCGFCASDYNGAFGVSTTGTILGVQTVGNAAKPYTVGTGIDFTGMVFGPYLLNSDQITIDTNGSALVKASGNWGWMASSVISSPSDGVIELTNHAGTDFGRLQFGGITASFPSLKRSGTTLIARLADDSADTAVEAAGFISGIASKTLVLKQGANGAAGTFVCTSGGTIIISNTNVAATDVIPISVNTVSGTNTANPFVNALTPASSFSAKCASGDVSTYNYAILKNAP